MTTKLDGGQAFASSGSYRSGMTLRDYFAAQAMTAIIGTAAAPCLTGLSGAEAAMARAAYEIADAMLNERIKK